MKDVYILGEPIDLIPCEKFTVNIDLTWLRRRMTDFTDMEKEKYLKDNGLEFLICQMTPQF